MLKIICVLVIFCWLSICAQDNNVCSSFESYMRNMTFNPDCWYDPDVTATPQERAQNNGFLLEEHKVRTDDGYILTTFRLKNLNGLYGKEVVFLQHGMTTDSDSFMVNKENSIAFFLAKLGYDVWLGNYRGTEYCEHEQLTASDPDYWDFSYHEHGVYDLPANFRYINDITKRKIIYIGHSMGSTAMAIYASVKPSEAEQYLKHTILLAPAIYLRHTKGLASLDTINSFYELLTLLPQMSLNVLLEINSFERLAFRKFCFSTMENMKMCLRVLEELGGKNLYPPEPEKFPMIFSAIKNLAYRDVSHYIQAIRSGEFKMYDYGPEKNLVLYNSETPPDYNLTSISIPMSWVYGTYDNLATKEDVLYTFKTFYKPNWDLYEIPHNHLDFLFYKSAKKGILPMLRKIIKKIVKG